MYYSEENPRKSCNGKPVEAIRLMYTPNEDARGDDRVVVEVVYSSGESRAVHLRAYGEDRLTGPDADSKQAAA